MKNDADSNLIVADTSPLIALAIMGLLPVLKNLFKKVLVPEAVVNECLHDVSKPQSSVIEKALREQLLELTSVSDIDFCEQLEQVLDQGEAEAISLAKEWDATVLMDEKAGRKVAHREGIICIGSLYILIKAKQYHFITSATPLIRRLLEHGYYLDDKLIDTVLLACNELTSSPS